MPHVNIVGQHGEDLAVEYLLSRGYQIIGRNAQIGHLEIDIIAKKAGKIIFIEVKARKNPLPGELQDSLSTRKVQDLKRAINQYLIKQNIDFDCAQLDLILVKIHSQNEKANIRHFKEII